MPLAKVKDIPLRTDANINIGKVVANPKTIIYIIEITDDKMSEIFRPFTSEITPVGTSNRIIVNVNVEKINVTFVIDPKWFLMYKE